jgi:hypothetical protein
VGLVCPGFDNTVRLAAKFRGLADARLVMFPPPNISVQTPDEVREHAKSLVDTVIAELTRTTAGDDAAAGVRANPRDIVFRGDLDAVNEFFHENRWTEGLPVVPPTRAAVEAMLKFTDREPDEVVGVLRPGRREVTVWKTAVNGVMAGCRPEYLPILLAIMEAEADPNSGIEGFNSTSGQFPVIILNGPIIKELNINHGQGMVRGRRQANMSISRFLSLCMINIARLRLGETDMTTFDRNYYPAVAEAEEDSPWEPLSETLGFKPGSNVVTVQGAAMMGYSFLSEGDAESHLRIMAQEVARDLGNSHYLIHPMLGPVTSHGIYIGPQVANIIAKAGYSKQDVKQYLFDHARVPAHQLEEFMKRHALLPDIDPKDITFCEMVRQGRLPKHFCESEDPNRMVAVVQNPDEFLIVVTGLPTRNRSRILRQGGQHGRRVSREIKLPTNWQQLCRA